MAVSVFHPNQIVRFSTSYDEDGDDLTGWRYYLLWKFEEKEKMLIFFPLTSNHNHRNITFVTQYKVTAPRPPCLESAFYPNSFVNANRLVLVPYLVLPFLKFCQKCPKSCLSRKDFVAIVKLNSDLPKYHKKIKRIELNNRDFC